MILSPACRRSRQPDQTGQPCRKSTATALLHHSWDTTVETDGKPMTICRNSPADHAIAHPSGRSKRHRPRQADDSGGSDPGADHFQSRTAQNTPIPRHSSIHGPKQPPTKATLNQILPRLGIHFVNTTYIPTREAWLYLATIMDLTTRQIVGWAMDSQMPWTLVARGLGQMRLNTGLRSLPPSASLAVRKRSV